MFIAMTNGKAASANTSANTIARDLILEIANGQ